MSIDPVTPATVYVGTTGANGGVVFKSTDGGANWATVNANLTERDVRVLSIDPTTPTTLYAGTLWKGVFKSIDGGTNWAAANTGLTSLNVSALSIDPTTPATLYAGPARLTSTAVGGVFKSITGGE